MVEAIETSFASLSALVSDARDVAAWWTLHYAFHVHRAGVLVVIDDGHLTRLIPFVNTCYDNTFALHRMPAWRLVGSAEKKETKALESLSVAEYAAAKACALGLATPEPTSADVRDWWLNGHVVCNVKPPPGAAGDALWNLRGLDALRDMLLSALELHQHQHAQTQKHAPNQKPLLRARLVLNKRDTPLLKRDGSAPLDAMAGFCSPPPVLHNMWAGVTAFTRPLSLYGSPAFADVLIPPAEHWELAVRGAAAAAKLAGVPWSERAARAVFRGTATGPGAALADNQRLQLAAWAAHPPHAALADVALTALSWRDRVRAGRVVFMDASSLAKAHVCAQPGAALPPEAQARAFKYQIYADGHCASSRLAWLLLSGSLVFKLDSPREVVAPDMWLSPLLTPGVHYVAVRADLSDLAAAIRWAQANDARASRIAAQGQALARELLQPHVLADTTLRALEAAVVPFAFAFASTSASASASAFERRA